jgi:hypothetical protein
MNRELNVIFVSSRVGSEETFKVVWLARPAQHRGFEQRHTKM